jgi:hypothetical protein
LKRAWPTVKQVELWMLQTYEKNLDWINERRGQVMEKALCQSKAS